jgi:hypothetical protein
MSKRIKYCFVGLLLLITACTSQQSSPHPTPLTAPSDTSISTSTNAVDQQQGACTDPVPADSRFGIKLWPRTDFCQHSIPYEEIRGIVGRDRIAALDDPGFDSIEEADIWLTDPEPVQVLQIGADVRAYPLPILIWHEIVNDVVGGEAVVVTYCPLCNSALVFERTVDGHLLDFDTTGNIRKADLIMYDRQTESWWQQFEGQAIAGELTGAKLSLLPSTIVSYADFKTQYPEGQVLAIDTGFDRRYGETPYINYDSLANFGTRFFDGETDDRLPPKMRVLALSLGDTSVAYPYAVLEDEKAINDRVENQPLVILWKRGTLSPVFSPLIFESKDIGSAAAFSRQLNGRLLTFQPANGDRFQDQETGSQWNIFGTAVSGPLVGEQLTPLTAHEFFWFAWAAFQPETSIYQDMTAPVTAQGQ